jgi:hypothetical protein
MSGRLYLFAGHYGSGKSEISVNFTFNLALRHKTAIVDFDIINPYFRTAGARAALEKKGVRVITPVYANTNVDVPALPAEISALFDDKGIKAVFDVGGDSAGARAVSRYHDEFISEKAENFFVFNIRRPMTANINDILDVFHEIQDSARLPFTALVNNTNLLSETKESDLHEGLDAALDLSDRLSLPIAFNALMADDANEPGVTGFDVASQESAFTARSRKIGVPVFYISKYIRMDYL